MTTISLLPWQVGAWKDKAPIMLLTGAAGGGKSMLAGSKINTFLARYEGSTGLVLRKAREYCKKSVIPFLRHSVMDAGYITYKKSDGLFEYRNGSTLYIGGMKDRDQRESIRSIGREGGLDIVWMEEANAFRVEDFEEIFPRMRGQAAAWTQIILSTNPDDPYHWINSRLIRGGEASVHYSSYRENPHLPSEYISMMDRLTGVRRLRLRDGKWVRAEGTVYDEFDPQLHVIDPFALPPGGRYLAAVDWGFTNPGVIQVWLIDADGRMILVEEVYLTARLLSWWVANARGLHEKYGIEKFVCDPAAPGNIEEFQAGGLPAVGGNNDIILGIQKVKARLRRAGDGKPRLMLCRGATGDLDPPLVAAYKPASTDQEFGGYVWPEGVDGKPIKEKPVDENNHGLDALRYLVMDLDDHTPPPAGETIPIDMKTYFSQREERRRLWRSP